jgi:hypothetical protein
MMPVVTMLLLTDRGSSFILNSTQGRRMTYQCELVLHSSYAASGQIANKRPGAKRRTVEPGGARQVPTTIVSKYEIAYRSYSGLR